MERPTRTVFGQSYLICLEFELGEFYNELIRQLSLFKIQTANSCIFFFFVKRIGVKIPILHFLVYCVYLLLSTEHAAVTSSG